MPDRLARAHSHHGRDTAQVFVEGADKGWRKGIEIDARELGLDVDTGFTEPSQEAV